MRKKIIAGNWKMNKTPSETVKLIEELKPLVKNDEVDDYTVNNMMTTLNTKKGLSAHLFSRFIQLSGLSYVIKIYDQNKMIPNLLEQYQFLKEVDSCALRTASFNLEDAYKNFFNKSGFPKYNNFID